MRRHLTLAEYRSLDLALFGGMLLLSEYIITTAATRWFPGQPFTVSVTAAISAIVLMRWGMWAAIHAVLGGAIFCYAAGGTAQQYLIYCIGNLFCLAAVLLLRKDKGEKLRKDKLLSMLFGLLVILLMQLGRAVTATVTGGGLRNFLGFFTTDTLSDLFAMVIVYIVRQLDGIFENQRLYLIRLQKQNEKGGF